MRNPRPIRVLDPVVANKIAAGEVIERPASVVKELIENAVDAGATDLRVEVRGGGLQLIRVVDNGWGMGPEEVGICFQRHATSKIETADDLVRIETLGFRGEALPSIAAVAELTIVTQRAGDAAGTFVTVENGVAVDEGKRGGPGGTTVSVLNLFRNFPARLKYMKSAGTESGHISNLVSQFALAYPELRLTLVSDGRMAFQSIGDGDLFSALVKVYGLTTAEGMVRIRPEEGGRTGVKVWGYVGGPGVSRSNRNCLSFFVNRRWVQSRNLAFAVADACHPLLADGRHPVAAINIEVPADEVDVNVHPTKSEVRFLRDREVFVSVQNAVKRALVEYTSLSTLTSSPGFSLPSVEHRLETVEREPAPLSLPLPKAGPPFPQGAAVDESESPRTERELSILRVIGQMGNTFIIAEGPNGMYLVDQHRAHERVLFERLRRERGGTTAENGPSGASQLLLDPLVIELAATQFELFEARLEELSRLGFGIEPFGDRSLLVRAVPSVLANGDVGESLVEIIDQTTGDSNTENWQEELLATIACRGAIKAGQALTSLEMRELLLQLEATAMASICPHGAPIVVHLSQAQLEKQFGR